MGEGSLEEGRIVTVALHPEWKPSEAWGRPNHWSMNHNPSCPACGASLPVPASVAPDASSTCPECGNTTGILDPGEAVTQKLSGQAPGSPEVGSSSSHATVHGPPPGTLFHFGEYEVQEIIAHGGMGIVYKARHVALDRVVALKCILRERLSGPRDIERFMVEARSAAKLRHPNIVAVHEVGEVQGEHFYSMDYVAGQTLAKVVGDNPLTERKAATYLKQIARAIHYAHGQGVLHRDLKPGNIIIDWNDEPQVTDFGIAKILDTEVQQTVDGTVIGTPSYMSPEQATGQNQILDARSDVYSLGAVLYELLTGRPPFRAPSSLATLRLVLEREPVPPRQMSPRMSRDLETICLKCLQKRPASRYESAAALADDLDRFLRQEPILARRIGLAERSWRWCRRKPALSISLAIAVLLMLVVSIGSPLAAWQLNLSKNLAEDRALAARRNAYAADMRTVQTAIEESHFGYALQLLEWHRPRLGEEDIRNWEWRHFWRLCQSDDLATLTRHDADVYAALVSPSGRWLASWSADSMVKLWNMKEQREEFSVSNGGAPPPAFLAGDRYLAIPLSTHDVTLLDLQTLNLLPPAFAHSNELRKVAFDPEGAHLMTYDRQAVRRWDLETRREIQVTPVPAADHAVFNADWSLMAWTDHRIISVGRTGAQPMWKLDTGHNPAGSARIQMAFTPDASILAVSIAARAGGGWTIQFWDMATGQQAHSLPAHAGAITELTFSPQGRFLATSSYDQTTQVWDTRDWRQIRILKGHNSPVFHVSFLPDGEHLVTAARDRTVRYWQVRSDEVTEPRLELDPGLSTELISERRGTMSPDGRALVMIRADGTGMVVDALTLREKRRLALPYTDIGRVALGPGGTTIACSRPGGVIALWDVEKEAATELALPDGNEVGAMAFSSDGGWFTARGRGKELAVWRRSDLQEVNQWRARLSAEPDLRAAVFSPDSQRLALGHTDGSVTVWDVHSVQRIARFPGLDKGILAMAFSADGTRLGVTSYDSPALVWDLTTGQEAARFSGNHSSFFRIGFSVDGTRLFLSEWENGRIFDVDTKREVARLKSYYPRFLDVDAVLGLGEHEMWHWRPLTLSEIDARIDAGSASDLAAPQ